jgi:transcriptional regulator
VSLTERERAVLRLRAEGLSDYRIARRLRVDATGVCRSRLNALRKIERARVDLEFAKQLKV